MKKGVRILMHTCFWFYIFAWHGLIGGFFVAKKNYDLSYFFEPLAVSHYIVSGNFLF